MATARATSSRLRSPWDKVDAFSRAISEIPANSRASMALASIFLTHSPLFMARGERQDTMTLAMIGSRLKGLMFWKVQAIPLFTISQVFKPDDLFALEADRAGIGFQNAGDQPQEGGLSRAVGPIRPSISSRPMEKLTSLIALSPPKSLCRFTPPERLAPCHLPSASSLSSRLETLPTSVLGSSP